MVDRGHLWKYNYNWRWKTWVCGLFVGNDRINYEDERVVIAEIFLIFILYFYSCYYLVLFLYSVFSASLCYLIILLFAIKLSKSLISEQLLDVFRFRMCALFLKNSFKEKRNKPNLSFRACSNAHNNKKKLENSLYWTRKFLKLHVHLEQAEKLSSQDLPFTKVCFILTKYIFTWHNLPKAYPHPFCSYPFHPLPPYIAFHTVPERK